MSPLLATALLAPLIGASPVEKMVSFLDTRQCHRSDAFDALVGRMATYDPQTESVTAGDPIDVGEHELFRPRIERTGSGWFLAAIDVHTAWHGLFLLHVELESGIESGPFNVGMVFAEPPEVALRQLNMLGFDLPGVERPRVLEEEVIEAGLRLERRGGGSVLWCFSD